MSPGPRRRFFTLLEVLIASAILAGVASLLLLAGNAVMAAWSKLAAENQEFSELLAVDRTLENLLGNVVPFRWPQEERGGMAGGPGREMDATAEPTLWFAGEPARLRFCYRHELNSLADGALRFVELAVEDDALVAFYQERPFRDWGQGRATARRAQLARDVATVEFRYADAAADSPEPVWTDQWDPERTFLPLAIWLRVTWRNGREESWLFRTPGAGAAERLGNWQPK